MQRGDIIRVNLPQPMGRPGHEQFGTRPAVVIQSAAGENLSTVIVVPLTSNQSALKFAGSFLVNSTPENGLTSDSVVLTAQLRAIDRRRIEGSVVGRLSVTDRLHLDDQVKLLLFE